MYDVYIWDNNAGDGMNRTVGTVDTYVEALNYVTAMAIAEGFWKAEIWYRGTCQMTTFMW